MVVTEPNKLWEIACDTAGLSRDSFVEYYEGKKQAVGIKLGKVQVLNIPRELRVISEKVQAPQSYRYLTQEQFQTLTE